MGKDLDLLHAAKSNDVGGVRKILGKIWSTKTKKTSKKYNLNIQDEDGFTALHHAALKGNTDITMALLDVLCNVNARDKKGMAPLHLASWAGKTEIVKLLVDARACVNICADSGDTPLHLACQHCNVGVVEVLLDSNVDSTVVNKNGESALDLACRFGHAQVVDMLLKSKDCNKLLSLYEENPKTADPPLHIACKTGREEIVVMLLDAGADINQKGANGTPLHEASLYGKTYVVKILLDNFADVNLPNDEGHVPLDLVMQFTSSRASQEIKDLLRDASKTKIITAKAIHDYQNIYDPTCLALRTGDVIEILEQCESGRWKGKITSGKREMVGFFPSTMVKIQNARKSAGSGKAISMNSGVLPLGKYEMVALPTVAGQPSPGRDSRPRMSSFGKPNGRASPSPPVSPEKQQKQTTDIQQKPTKRKLPNLIANGLEESKLFNKKQESLQYVEVSVDNRSPPPTSPGSSNGFRTQYAEVVLHSPVNGTAGDEDPPSLPQKSYKHESEKYDNEERKGKEDDDSIWVKNSSDLPELPLKTSSVSKDTTTTIDTKVETDEVEQKVEENNMKDENENGMTNEMGGEDKPENEEDLLLTQNGSSDLEKAILNLDSKRPKTPENPSKSYEDMSLISPDGKSLPERKKLEFHEREFRGSPSTDRRQVLSYENVELNKHRPKDAAVNTMLISDIDLENDPDYVHVKQGVSPDPRNIAPNKKHRYENVPQEFECMEESGKEGTEAAENNSQNYENMAGVGEFEPSTPRYVPMQGAVQGPLSKTDSYENIDIKTEESTGSAEYMLMIDGVHTGSNRDYINIQLPDPTEMTDHYLPGAPSGLTMNEYNSLYDWLETCKLVIYIDNFVQGGFDMTSMVGLTAEDLTAINIIKTGHRKKLLSESSKMNLTSDDFPHERRRDIIAWLQLIHLDQYTPQFMDNGFDDMDFVQDITIEDLVSIGITKPGHQRKLWLAVNALELANPEENREINPKRVDVDKQESNVEGYLETDLDMVEEKRAKEREVIEVQNTDIDSALSRLPADGASDVAVPFEDVSAEQDERSDKTKKQTPKKTLDNALASLQIESLNDTRGSTPDLDSILDSLDKDSSPSPERKTVAPQSQTTDRRSSGPFQMSFSRRSSSSKDRMSADSGLRSRSFVENRPEASADVNEISDNNRSSRKTVQSHCDRTSADIRLEDGAGATPSEDTDVTALSRGRHNTMDCKPSVAIGDSSFDRGRGTSFDSKTSMKRPPPPVKPKTFKKPPPIAPKPSPAKTRAKHHGGEKEESIKTDDSQRESCHSNGSSPKKTPPPSLSKTRNGSMSSQSASSEDSIEAALEDLEKRKHYEGRRKSFEKLKRRFTDPSSESIGHEVESNDLGTRSSSQQGLQEQIKDVFKRRSHEDVPVDQEELKPFNQVGKDDVATDEELLKDQQYTEDLMKDINSMLSDFSSEIETMFDDQADKSTSV